MLLESLTRQLGQHLLLHGQSVTSAESCTGGLISAALTDIAGASAWFNYGFVTYSDQAKQTLLGVPSVLLQSDGAVSERVVRAMAEGALARAAADWAIAVSGIAGPGGGSAKKPVGTVWLAIATRTGPTYAWLKHFAGDRATVRHQTVESALTYLLDQLQHTSLIA